MGGYKTCILEIKGEYVYSKLKYEVKSCYSSSMIVIAFDYVLLQVYLLPFQIPESFLFSCFHLSFLSLYLSHSLYHSIYLSFSLCLFISLYQAGVHRVQRVPITDGAGKVQTSTATVAVMPEVNLNFGVLNSKIIYGHYFLLMIHNLFTCIPLFFFHSFFLFFFLSFLT